MRNIVDIKIKLKYERQVAQEFKSCTEGTEGYERLKIAENIVNVLEWVLDIKDNL